MRFRPCIDLHRGAVKQVVGSTLTDREDELVTNFVASESPAHFAQLYRRDGLEGGHVIMLGPGNEVAAEAALRAYPQGLQIGGGIRPDNAQGWLAVGAQKVIVTSYVFSKGEVKWDRLTEMKSCVGKERLVLDLSCRKRGDAYVVVTNRWQLFTELVITPETLERLADYCAEFLIHAVDVEGKQAGIDDALIECLADMSPLPVTYAGGIRNLDDLYRVEELGSGRVDATAGSSLDIFGGAGLRYVDAVAFDRARRREE